MPNSVTKLGFKDNQITANTIKNPHKNKVQTSKFTCLKHY